MTPSEIAETLINGNISDAREAIIGAPGGIADSAVLALDVLDHMTPDGESGLDWQMNRARLRRCLTGGT